MNQEVWPGNETQAPLGHCNFCGGRIVFVATSYANRIVCQGCREHLVSIENDEWYKEIVKWRKYFGIP